MDRQYIREHQVIERYLRGTLTPDEEQAFEEAYLGDPELLDEIELAERLRDGVKELGAAGGIERLSPRKTWFNAPFARQWAAAASVLLVVSLAVSGGLCREKLTLRPGSGLVAGMNTRLLPVVTLRGDPETELEAPGADAWAVLLVDPGFTPYDSYRAVVARVSGDDSVAIWSVDGLETEYQDQLAIGLPGRLLPPDRYEIVITGRLNDWAPERSEQVSRTALRVVAPTDD